MKCSEQVRIISYLLYYYGVTNGAIQSAQHLSAYDKNIVRISLIIHI